MVQLVKQLWLTRSQVRPLLHGVVASQPHTPGETSFGFCESSRAHAASLVGVAEQAPSLLQNVVAPLQIPGDAVHG